MRDLSPSITELDEVVNSLPKRELQLFHRIMAFDISYGELRPPPEMVPWIEERFGSVEEVAAQKIVKVFNKITCEGALYNRLRASRPLEMKVRLAVEARLMDEYRGDPLNNPAKGTPEDIFGRVHGDFCITAANIAKYDGFHAIVIFDEHNPLRFTEDSLIDYFDTGWRWAELAHKQDPEARYFMFLWNCLWKAGASLPHGHAQVVMGRKMHYARVEALRRAALGYCQEFNADYFHDLFLVHQALGCAWEKEGIRIIAYLTPVKEKEVLFLADSFSVSLKQRIHEVLTCYRDELGVMSFNLIINTPPWGPPEPAWEGFPVLARLVDRGDPTARASDIGAMELYASNVISSDPFQLAKVIKEALYEK